MNERRIAEGVARLGSLQKSAHGAPGYSRWVNRRMGRYLAATAWSLGMTPNQVTALSAAFSGAAIVSLALARPTVVTAVAQGLGLVIGYALDSADGQLARLAGSSSRGGEWLDHVVDAVKTATLHLAVAIGWFRFADLPAQWLLVPLGFSAVTVVLFFAMTLTDQLRRAATRQGGVFMAGERQSASTLYSLAVLPLDYGVVCWVFVLAGWPFWFRWAYLALFAAHLAFVVAALPKWYREVSRLPVA